MKKNLIAELAEQLQNVGIFETVDDLIQAAKIRQGSLMDDSVKVKSQKLARMMVSRAGKFKSLIDVLEKYLDEHF